MGTRWWRTSTRETFPKGHWAPNWRYPLVMTAAGGSVWAFDRFVFDNDDWRFLLIWIVGAFSTTAVWRWLARRSTIDGSRVS